MQLVLVTARLDAPVASSYPIHLDTIAAQAFLRVRVGREGRVTRGTAADQIAHPECYIERLSCLSSWVYAASAVVDDGGGVPGREHLVKRRDPIDAEMRARPFMVASGPDRDYLLPVPTLEAPLLRWLAIADRRELKGILKTVRRVGGERSQGMGSVREWSFEACDEDPAHVLVRHGRAARNLPALWCVDPKRYGTEATRPPYWSAAHREPAVRAGMPAQLLPEVAEAVRSLCR
jgi:hypothetical protein